MSLAPVEPSVASDKPLAQRGQSTNRLNRAWLTMATLAGAVYIHFGLRRLWHTDLWGHLAYGRWIWEQGSLPTTEPLLPLADGVPYVDTAWLSKLIGYAVFESAGPTGLQALHGLCVAGCCGLLAWTLYRRLGDLRVALLGGGLLLLAGWQHWIIIRPQLAGQACLLVLLLLATQRQIFRRDLFGMLLLFAAWSNLHGSLLVGYALLAVLILGRVCDLYIYDQQSIRSCWRDRRIRFWTAAIGCGLLGAMFNPTGPWVLMNVVQLSGHPNLADLVEWQPLRLWMQQTQIGIGILAFVILIYLLTPKRRSTGELLLLVGTTTAAILMSRMIVWWAIIVAYFPMAHLSEILAEWGWKTASNVQARLNRRDALLTLVGAAVIVLATAGLPQLYYGHDNPHWRLSRQTPVAAAEFLDDQQTGGLIFNTYELGDYLLWSQPGRIQPFVASHAHLIPPQVWTDYMTLIGGRSGWDAKLQKYDISMAVLLRDKHARLESAMRQSATWESIFEDDATVIFHRN